MQREKENTSYKTAFLPVWLPTQEPIKTAVTLVRAADKLNFYKELHIDKAFRSLNRATSAWPLAFTILPPRALQLVANLIYN